MKHWTNESFCISIQFPFIFVASLEWKEWQMCLLFNSLLHIFFVMESDILIAQQNARHFYSAVIITTDFSGLMAQSFTHHSHTKTSCTACNYVGGWRILIRRLGKGKGKYCPLPPYEPLDCHWVSSNMPTALSVAQVCRAQGASHLCWDTSHLPPVPPCQLPSFGGPSPGCSHT